MADQCISLKQLKLQAEYRGEQINIQISISAKLLKTPAEVLTEGTMNTGQCINKMQSSA